MRTLVSTENPHAYFLGVSESRNLVYFYKHSGILRNIRYFLYRYTLVYVIYAIPIKVFPRPFSKRPENSRKESLQFEIPRQQQVQRGISIRDQALGLVQDGFFQRVTGHTSVAIFGGVL